MSIYVKRYTNSTRTNFLDKKQYYDGLGHPIQTVEVGITPNLKNLITIQQYDGFGRQTRTWLSAAIDNTTGGAYISPTVAMEKARATHQNEAKPYSFPDYETSPLNRVLGQYGSGNAWHSEKKGIKTEYSFNKTIIGQQCCFDFSVVGSLTNTTLKKGGSFLAEEIFITKMEDEDGNIKDKLGKVILFRQVLGETQYGTYYVYDDFGNLCYVLPPFSCKQIFRNKFCRYI